MDTSTLQLATLPVWGVGAYLDYRYRHAPNRLWVLLGVIGFGVLGAEASVKVVGAALFGLCAITPVALWLWHSGRVGGADAKALMILPVCYPLATFSIVALMGVLTAGWLPLRDHQRGVPLLIPLSVAVTAAVLLW